MVLNQDTSGCRYFAADKVKTKNNANWHSHECSEKGQIVNLNLTKKEVHSDFICVLFLPLKCCKMNYGKLI